MKQILKIFLLVTAAGLIGLVVSTMIFAIFIETNEPTEEWIASFWWLFIYYMVSAPIVYIPGMFALRRLLHGDHPTWAFPIAGVLAGIVPMMLFVAHWGGSLNDPEIMLRILGMYAPVGLMFGGSFVWLFSKEPSKT